ncbi:hypothetical protein KQI88_03915 [Alkaliphilus sp. MSJ-5]|uniref:Uncharacterized protein n=1 Tax=Alkaliphilus flagellatus TaxID=2841507 RepID=A0ABS6G2F0_9FIRM|nr:hypothetical protein [Alkaliphilus flagellatus]MBU5675556.1 hypothetical protein [Alkaliphilus flagellatus]
MFKIERIKSFIPFIMGFIAYNVVTTILNLLGKNKEIIKYTTFIIIIMLYIIISLLYEKNNA